jgi:hypothetical protein
MPSGMDLPLSELIEMTAVPGTSAASWAHHGRSGEVRQCAHGLRFDNCSRDSSAGSIRYNSADLTCLLSNQLNSKQTRGPEHRENSLSMEHPFRTS